MDRTARCHLLINRLTGSFLVATPLFKLQLTRTGTPQSLHMLDYLASPEEVAGMDEMQAAVWTQQQGLADAIDWVVRCAVFVCAGL